MLKYQNIKMFLQKVTFQIGPDKFLSLKMLRMLCHGHMLLMILMEKKSLENFTKTNCKNQIKENLELKKKQREKVINYMLNEKDIIIRLIIGSIKKTV